MVISVLQRYKTDFSTLIGWYINIISVNEITVFNCKCELNAENIKCCYRILYGRIPPTTATVFIFTVNFTVFFFYSAEHVTLKNNERNHRSESRSS